MSANRFQRPFAKAAVLAGTPGLVPKDLRSTNETKLYELGWPGALVSKWQAHTSEVSYRHYVSVRDELGAKAVRDLDDTFLSAGHGQAVDKSEASGAG